MINLKIFCFSSSDHVNQLFSGFGELVKRRFIRVELIKMHDYCGDRYSKPLLKVEIDGGPTIIYDTSDSYRFFENDDTGYYDFYFKRMLRIDDVNLVLGNTFPLGLNVPVFSRHDFALQRIAWSWNSLDAIKRAILYVPPLSIMLNAQSGLHDSSIKKLEQPPEVEPNPRVIFMTQAWNPSNVKSKQKKDERIMINEMRAACIKSLRKQFGKRFLGGFYINEFSRKHYKECLVTDNEMTLKSNYLRVLKDFSVGIATMGLDGSVGWKFAEYVTNSKAIISEKFDCLLPGDFEENKNYLSFVSADECVERVAELIDDRERIYQMMVHNHAYYHAFLRPDRLVWNTLQIAMARGK